jgi:glutathione S-transferase
MDRLTLHGSFTSSSSYKAMLYLALARLPLSFRTVNLKTGVQTTPEYLAVNRWGVVPSLRHRGLTILQSNVILDYLARETGQFVNAARHGVRAVLDLGPCADDRHGAAAPGDARPRHREPRARGAGRRGVFFPVGRRAWLAGASMKFDAFIAHSFDALAAGHPGMELCL